MKRIKEYVLYGTRQGEESWQEELITTVEATLEGFAKLKKAHAWAEQQGFTSFRVSEFTPGTAPDFTKVFKG